MVFSRTIFVELFARRKYPGSRIECGQQAQQSSSKFPGEMLVGPGSHDFGLSRFAFLPADLDHPSIFAEPLSPAQALDNVRALLSPAHVRAVSEEAGFVDFFGVLTSSHAVSGNRVPDWHLATLLKQHGVSVIYTTDKGFPRFSQFRPKNPFRSEDTQPE
jgi:hypothetical protein